MTLFGTVSEALKMWPAVKASGDHVIVPTHCLYGSGSIVRVRVEGRGSRFVVHDGGSAIDEFSNSGGIHPKCVPLLRNHFREQGILVTEQGALCSPLIASDSLAPTIALVANASKEGEDFLMSRWKPRVRRDFKKLLRQLLEAEFRQIKTGFRMPGSSTKQHTFDFALDRQVGGVVLLDAVHNDQNAISSAVMRNLDVGKAHPRGIEQRIVIDDAEEWRAEDLNLLSMGARVVTLSNAQSVLARLVA